MEYWSLVENQTGEVYQQLINVLCSYSDKFYFITRKELSYDMKIIKNFEPYIVETYKTKKWANTMTDGPSATVYVIDVNPETCLLLQQLANSLYDWVSPKLPEDLTFIKNNHPWFTSTAHEEFAIFSIRSDYYRNIMKKIDGLTIQMEE